jgi:hypothetical protein
MLQCADSEEQNRGPTTRVHRLEVHIVQPIVHVVHAVRTHRCKNSRAICPAPFRTKRRLFAPARAHRLTSGPHLAPPSEPPLWHVGSLPPSRQLGGSEPTTHEAGEEASPPTLSSAEKLTLQSFAAAFPGNAVLHKCGRMPSAACAFCGQPRRKVASNAQSRIQWNQGPT